VKRNTHPADGGKSGKVNRAQSRERSSASLPGDRPPSAQLVRGARIQLQHSGVHPQTARCPDGAPRNS
jgi:hypothetical protein